VKAAVALALIGCAAVAHAEGLADSGVLERPRGFHIESARLRFTWFDQSGHGFQSLAGGPALGPGTEELWVAQPQLEIVARQGENITHRLWVPVDVISAASPDAIDVTSSSSRYQEAGSIDIASTYKVTKVDEISTRFAVHLEENFRSWSLGGGWTRHMADDNAVFQASLNQTFDWLDAYLLGGANREREGRSTTNLNLSFTQILSPTTVGHLNYGLTVQTGELGNTWNTIPLADLSRGQENLPRLRHRHAFVGRIVQALPWKASLKLSYRFYIDSWGAMASTIETFLYQRFTRYLYARVTYRAHIQKGVDFWTELAPLGDGYRTADSDLQSFTAHTFGAKLALDLPLKRLKSFGLDFAYERYMRSNDLVVNVYSSSVGWQF
jgi:hypothetical protein